MADSHSLNKPHFQYPDSTSPLIPINKPTMSFKSFIIVILVLVVLPLFPSRAPDFINQTPLTKVWELLYLLFIGITVSYGLFSRRTVKLNSEACSNFATVKPQIWSPLTGISQISSIFENGFENSCGFDELKIPQVFSPFSKGVYSNGCSVLDNSGNFRSSVFENGFGKFNGSNGKKVGQALDSQYFAGESVVLDQFGKPSSSIEYKPLGLPIRSLRSKNLDPVGLESTSVSGSGLSFKGSCNGCDRVESGRVRGMVPTNLEGQFKDAVAPSPIPWCSRSARMEMREETGTVKSHSQFRPTYAGEFEPKCLKSRSFRYSMPSHTSSKHSSSGMSSFASNPSELPELKMEDLKGKEKFDGSRPSSLQPSLAPLSGDSSIRSSNTRHFSIGSTAEMNVQIISKDDWEDFTKSTMDTLDSSRKPNAPVNTHSKGKFPNAKMEDLKGKEKLIGPQLQSKQPSLTSFNGVPSFKSSNARSLSMGSSAEVKVHGVTNYLKDFLETKEDNVLGRVKQTIDLSKLNQKPAVLVNGYTPGKSVRTIRSSEKLVDAKETGKVFPRSIDDKFGMNFAEGDMVMDTIKGNLDNILETKFEIFDVSSDEEEAGLDMFSDAEPHSGEVDRKADEFIAKFKEQIRLQRTASRRLNFW